jgi:hypothetical protein
LHLARHLTSAANGLHPLSLLGGNGGQNFDAAVRS